MKGLYSLPRSVLAGLIICAGIAFLILTSPPKDLCDHQIDVYKQDNVNFIFPDKIRKVKVKTFYEKEIEQCYQTNSPGGCYALLHSIDRLILSFKRVQIECHQNLAQLKEVKQAFTDIYTLFVEISWEDGSRNPLGWLSESDVFTYCKLRNQMRYLYGNEYLDKLNKTTHKDKVENVSLDQFKQRSILSSPCALY